MWLCGGNLMSSPQSHSASVQRPKWLKGLAPCQNNSLVSWGIVLTAWLNPQQSETWLIRPLCAWLYLVKPTWFYCSCSCLCMVILHHVSPQFNPQRISLWTALDLETLHYSLHPGFQHRRAHNLGQCICNSTRACVCNIEWLGWNKRLHKDGEFSAQSLTSHPSCHRREITCSRALDTAVVAEDNALNQLFTPIEGINYQEAGK